MTNSQVKQTQPLTNKISSDKAYNASQQKKESFKN